MDGLDFLEQQGRLERQERKKARRELHDAPEAREKRERGRKARWRGRDYERIVCDYLRKVFTDVGEVFLVPASGAYGGSGPYYGATKLRGDIIIQVGDQTFQVQCKRTKALTTQRKWLDADDSHLLSQADTGERVQKSLLVMRAEELARLISAIRQVSANG